MSAAALVAELRAAGVADERVLAAIGSVPRERFVPRMHRRRAWADRPLPIGRGQTISQPLVVARMCGALEIRPGDRALDVGTGSGYHAAVLAALGARVFGIERQPRLAAQAVENLRAAGAGEVDVAVGDGTLGRPRDAPFDAIAVGACAQGEVPEALVAQLAPGGRLVAPVAGEEEELLVALRREPGGALRRTELGHVRFVPLLPGVAD